MRIISGTHRGRRFQAPPGLTTRPTSDRVRESLFMMLGSLEGAVVLDAFAGSGALGFEALSRGATSCTFIENHRPTARLVLRSISELGFEERCRVISRPYPQGLLEIRDRPTLVFFDPPYRADYAQILEAYVSSGAFLIGAIIVVEHPRTVTLGGVESLPFLWESTRRYGDTCLTIGEVVEE